MSKYLKRGVNSFYKKDFKNALLHFALALREKPSSKEARISAILAELAFEREDEAIALYEYYLISKDSGVDKCEDMIEDIVNSVDFTIQSIEALFIEDDIEAKINEENGIAYDDFKTFISNKDSFKEAFEDIMFSTKVIIHKKDDFIDFLEQLIDNGFKEVSMNYFESAVQLFPHDKKLLQLVKKVES